MLCDKCGTPHMIEDSTPQIEVYRCWVCGNRMYVNHPKRSGLLTCSKCGGTIEEKNALNYCRKCWEGLQIFKRKQSGGTKRPPKELHREKTEGSNNEGMVPERKT